MDTDTPPADPARFTRVDTALLTGGPAAAAAVLCDDLRDAGDYHALFYALLLKKRVELGVAPFPTGPSSELPPAAHEPYEDAIRDAARHVGQIYLDKNDIPRAWGFFRLIGEPGPVKDALAAYEPGPDDDTYPVVDIAWHQQLLPEKGFDIVLEKHGVCSAITLVGGADLTQFPDLRAACVRKLIRALHAQLLDRLAGDLAGRGTPPKPGTGILNMLAGKPELFADDAYHIDVSHLSSVVQMSLQLPPCEELALAAELCEYGRRLSPQYRGDADPPFENTYADYFVHINTINGVDVDGGLAHFRAKADAGYADGNPGAAEALVNLLLKLDRVPEALAAAKQYLVGVPDEDLSCPAVGELARRAGDYTAVAAAARLKDDLVTFTAGRIAAAGK